MAGATKGYVPALDGIRAIAVLGVLYTHFAAPQSSLGHLGVRAFFVLSAFLITGILLDSKERASASLITVLKKFYLHRSMRILPPYYLLLVILLMFGLLQLNSGTLAHFLFMSNYWFAIYGTWEPWPLAPLWSLAVEWQFYLFWPLIVLTIRPHKLTILCLFILLGSIFFRIYFSNAFPGDTMRDIWFPVSLDALAVGALLARHGELVKKHFSPLLILSLLCTIIAVYLKTSGVIIYYYDIDFCWILTETMLLLPVAVIMIACSANLFPRIIACSLGLWPLKALGKISYGVYLYHFPILWFLFQLDADLFKPSLVLGAPRLFFVGTMAILVAMASWYLLEKPMQKLRHRTPNKVSPAALA